MKRILASIQKIISVEPIENADKIEKVKVLGWQVIAKKDEFKEGQLCIFCEIDSVFPEKPEFEFLRSKKFRIKTQKMRGVLSQGIVFPLDILSDHDKLMLYEQYHIRGNINIIGQDVTEKLGITKFEQPITPQLMGQAKGNFPTYIVPKTDEIRLQSVISVLDEIKGKEVYITEKEDGTSFTAYYKDEFGFCSRNLDQKNELTNQSIYAKIALQYNLENKLKEYYYLNGVHLAIQGEITGDGINKNPLNLFRNRQQLHIFNVYDIDKQKYYDVNDALGIVISLGLHFVKIIEYGTFNYTLEQLLEKAKGKYIGTKNNIEGIVVRPITECYSNVLEGRLSFKVINNDYLLKEE